MNTQQLEQTARAMVAPGKGILAADESTGTIKKRFDTIRLESTEEHRRAYRELLFTAPGAGEFISGAILYDETLRQKATDGTPFPAREPAASRHLVEEDEVTIGVDIARGAVAADFWTCDLTADYVRINADYRT